MVELLRETVSNLPTFSTYNLSSLTPDCHNRMRFAARNLLRCRADLVCLQEISSAPGFLESFQRDYLENRYPYQVGPVGNDPRGMNVAVLSRSPIRHWQSLAEHSFPLLDGSRSSRFSRDLLVLDWEFEGRSWRIFSTHLKSMRGGPNAHRQRESEAAAILEVLAACPAELDWLLLGDLNDTPDSATLRRFFESPLEIVNSLKAGQQRTETFPCRGSRRQFDYILYPGRLANLLVDSRAWPESRASDHAMVTATFKSPGFEPLMSGSDH